MVKPRLTERDRRQIDEHGIPLDTVYRQIYFYHHPPPYIQLLRPCVVGDGIQRIGLSDIDRLVGVYGRARRRRSIAKFIPASGAASRMFQALLGCLERTEPLRRAALEQSARQGERQAEAVLLFLDNIDRFAFHRCLAAAMQASGLEMSRIIREGDVRELLAHLLTEKGLSYARLPKALLLFHRYDDDCRTALEEHLAEGARTVSDARGLCRLHFTVSPEHEAYFHELLADKAQNYATRYGVSYDVSFSGQQPASDSLAVTPDNEPLRDAEGKLLFRPAGHGALLANLNALDADLVFIKNIDNVVPEHLREPTVLWKQVLAGLALELQERIFAHLEALEAEQENVVDGAITFLKAELGTPLPAAVELGSLGRRCAYARKQLNRPLRVCGMVRTVGQAGGGPFWVEREGVASRQIVETTQIDPDSAAQQKILASATHFNPVDLVCCIRDYRGNKFDLQDYVDEDAVLVVKKHHGGRALRSLELPGLWNGSMAGWTTVFVEVPPDTFHPVKAINDLLQPAHQPRA